MAIAALLGSAAPASAALPMTFDALVADAVVTNQFTAADGVTFLNPAGASTAPEVREVGSTKASSGSKVLVPGCPACEFDDRVMRFQLSNFADNVQFDLGLNSTQSTTQPVVVRAIGANGSTTIGSPQTISASSANFRQHVTLTSASPEIGFVEISSTGGWEFGIDTLTFSATVPAIPTFGFAPIDAVTLRQGGTATVPVQVLRFNGSTGPISLTGLVLPTGVTASLSPNPMTGSASGTSTMTLTASPTADLGTSTFTGVQGTPGNPSAGTQQQEVRFSLTVERAFDLSTADTTSVTPCMPTTQQVFLTRARSGFTGTIALTADATDGYAVSLGETSLDGAGGASGHVVPMTITTTRSDAPAEGEVVIRATSGGVSERAQSVRISRDLGTVSSMLPTSGQTPWNLRPGTLVRVNGRGFCPGATVDFGSSRAQATAESVDPSGTWLNVRVPRLAVTGPLTVRMPGRGLIGLDTFTVNSPRSVEGFAFNNYDHPGVDLDAITDLYGADQTQITFDPCNPLPGLIPPICPIPTGIPNPLTSIYIGISNAALSGNGSCFGIAVTAERTARGIVPISRFAPAGSTTNWSLDAAAGPGTNLAREIQTWHTAQLSSSYLGYWIDSAAANVSNAGRATRSVLASQLGAGRHPFIALRNGGSGHVLVAHDLREGTTPGEYFVDVYDPNLEFLATENGDPADHQARADASVIHVRPGGNWSFKGAFDTEWSGGPDYMVAAPLSVFGSRPLMPTDPFGFVSLLVPLASSSAAVVQVEDGSGKQLLGENGDLNPDAAARPKGTITPTATGTDSRTMYALQSGGAAKVALRGTGNGTAGTAMLAPGFAAEVSGLKTSEGSTDELQLAAKSGKLDIDAGNGGDVEAKLARQLKNGDQVGAQVELDGGDRGDHGLRLDGGRAGLRYVNGGTGTARLKATLSWAGKKGTPGELTLPTLTVPKGGSAQGVPTSWGKLGESTVRLVVKNRRGKVVGRVNYKPRSVKRVAKLSLSVKSLKSGSRQASVRVRFRSVPKGATIKVGVYAKQGKNLVATDTIDVPQSKAKGTKTYRFDVDLPKGKNLVYGTATVIEGSKVSAAQSKRTVQVK